MFGGMGLHPENWELGPKVMATVEGGEQMPTSPTLTIKCRCPRPMIREHFGLRYCGKCLSPLPVKDGALDALTAQLERQECATYRLLPRQ